MSYHMMKLAYTCFRLMIRWLKQKHLMKLYIIHSITDQNLLESMEISVCNETGLYHFTIFILHI